MIDAQSSRRAPHTNRAPIAFLLDQADRRAVMLLLALMAGVSLTEGVGVLTLLPVLGGMNGDGGAGRIDRIASVVGFRPTLPTLLTFVTLLALARTALAHQRQMLSVTIQHRVVDRLRLRAFDAVLHADWRWLVRTKASDHANLILSVIARVGVALNQLLTAIALGIAAAGYLAAALLLSWRVALVTIALGAGVLALFAAQRARAAGHGLVIGEGGRSLHAYVDQTLAGMRIVKAFRTEDRRSAAFTQTVADLRTAAVANERMHAGGQAVLQAGSAITLALVLGIGHLTFDVAPAVLLPLLLAFARLAPMLGAVQANWATWRHLSPAVSEVQQFLGETGAFRECANVAAPRVTVTDAVRLERVHVRFAGRTEAALDDVSLTLRVNTTTALCGASGAGKSTLADVLMGLITPDEGALIVDGAAIRGSGRSAWRGSVAYVQQDAFLFHDTIFANVALGRDYTPAAVAAALTRAGAGFVHDLPDGLDTIVGDAGARLSGGERQRIALARALIGSPSLLILDEATSALDAGHELAVRRAIRALHGEVTILFITHRAEMREDADQLVTLDRGRVVGAAEATTP